MSISSKISPGLLIAQVLSAREKAIRRKLMRPEPAEIDSIQSQCSICLERFEDPTKHVHERPAKLQCGHIFGRVCIIKWLKQKTSCPECRAEVFPSQIMDCYFGLLSQLLNEMKSWTPHKTNTAEDPQDERIPQSLRSFQYVMASFMATSQATLEALHKTGGDSMLNPPMLWKTLTDQCLKDISYGASW